MVGNRQHRQWIIKAAKKQGLMPTTEGALDFKLNMTQLLDGYPGHEHALPLYPVHDDVLDLIVASQMAVTPTLLVAYGGPWAENYFYSRENPQHDPKLNHFTPKAELDGKTRRRPGWFMDEETRIYEACGDIQTIGRKRRNRRCGITRSIAGIGLSLGTMGDPVGWHEKS